MNKETINDTVVYQIAAKQDAIMHMLSGIMSKLTDGDANDILSHYQNIAKQDAAEKYRIAKSLEDKNTNH